MPEIWKTNADQEQISQDTSLFREGTESSLSSGSLWTLYNDLVMKYLSHNVAINSAGNYGNSDDAGPATILAITEGGTTSWGGSHWKGFGAASPGTAPGTLTFNTTPYWDVHLLSGAMTIGTITVNGGVLGQQLATPGQPTGTSATSGGTVAAGNNYCKVVGVDAAGGLTAGSTESAVVTTTGSTSSIQWVCAPLIGAVSYRFYLGTTSGSEANYATSSDSAYLQTAPASGLTSGTVPTVNNTGQVVGHGDTSGGTAAAGNVGEVVKLQVASGSAVSLTTATQANLGSLAIPSAGEWEVSVAAVFIPAATTTITTFSIALGIASATQLTQAGQSTVSGAFNLVDPGCRADWAQASAAWGANPSTLTIPPVIVKTNAAATLYVVALAAFATSTMAVYGAAKARRVR